MIQVLKVVIDCKFSKVRPDLLTLLYGHFEINIILELIVSLVELCQSLLELIINDFLSVTLRSVRKTSFIQQVVKLFDFVLKYGFLHFLIDLLLQGSLNVLNPVVNPLHLGIEFHGNVQLVQIVGHAA